MKKEPKAPKAPKVPKEPKAPRAGKKKGKSAKEGPDPRQLSIPFSRVAPSNVREAEALLLEAAADDPRTKNSVLQKVFSEEEIEAIEFLHRYEVYFEPETPILKKLRVKLETTRGRAEKEAARLRGMVHRPGKQYIVEDGDLVSVHVFDLRTMRWQLHYRRVYGIIENFPLPEENE